MLISGGGIAGPALAHWLRRAGFTPTIVERAPTTRAGGHRIDVGRTGLDILERMGVGEELRRVGAPLPALTLVVGRHDREVALPAQPGVGGDALSLRRGDISAAVTRLVDDAVEFVFDDHITSIEQRATSTRVTFARGRPRDFDLVVGADGINSQVRSLVFGPRERYAHFLGTNLAITGIENYLGFRDRMVIHTWPHRGLAITTFPDNAQLEATFLIRDTHEVDARTTSPRDLLGYVERAFWGAGWETSAVLERISPGDMHVAPSVQIRMPTWTAGRVALVGDAASCPDPMSGEGTTLALAGAYVLAGELAAAEGDPAVAFPAYERVMREVVAAGQGVGERGTSYLAPAVGPTGLWAREQALRAALPMLRVAARLGLGLVGTDKVGLRIPSYDFAPTAPTTPAP